MKGTELQQMVAEMRLLEARGKALEGALDEAGSTRGGGPAFSELMGESINQVNHNVATAEAKAGAFMREEPGVDLAETMVAINKAQVSFRMVVEVRNRLIQAYEDISKMPI